MFITLEGPDGTAGLTCDGYLAAANFAGASRLCAFTQQRPAIIPAYAGATVEVIGGRACCKLSIDGSSAVLAQAAGLLRVEGDARIDATCAGAVYVLNLGRQPARVEAVDGPRAGARLRLAPGEIKLVPFPV